MASPEIHYQFRDISPTFLSDSIWTLTSTSRVTQTNIGKYCMPLCDADGIPIPVDKSKTNPIRLTPEQETILPERNRGFLVDHPHENAKYIYNLVQMINKESNTPKKRSANPSKAFERMLFPIPYSQDYDVIEREKYSNLPQEKIQINTVLRKDRVSDDFPKPCVKSLPFWAPVIDKSREKKDIKMSEEISEGTIPTTKVWPVKTWKELEMMTADGRGNLFRTSGLPYKHGICLYHSPPAVKPQSKSIRYLGNL